MSAKAGPVFFLVPGDLYLIKPAFVNQQGDALCGRKISRKTWPRADRFRLPLLERPSTAVQMPGSMPDQATTSPDRAV